MYRLLKSLLRHWIRFDDKAETRLPELEARLPVIYVLQYHSLVDSIAADLFLEKHGMPVLRQISANRPVVYLLSRRQKKRFRRHRGLALDQLCREVAADGNTDYQLVPVSVFWGRTPNKEHSLFKLMFSDRWSIPGPVRKFFTLLFNGRATYVEANSPILIGQLAEEDMPPERLGRKVHRLLRVHFNRVRQRVIGPDLSHRRTLRLQIINSPAVREAITQHARTRKVPLDKARQEADKHLQEIMADISHPTIRVLDRFLARLWTRIYNGVEIRHLEPLKRLAERESIVYVPCHRSHIDYLLLSYSLYHQGLTIPHIAAGKNLNMPVVGPLLRRGGAFFMRRSFGGDKLYTTVFTEYLQQMFSRGIPVEYFVEGGRSRTGRTLMPKAGMLSMTVRGQLREPERTLTLVPVYIGYEKVFEANSYLKELRGRKKQSESLFGLLKTLRRLRNYGRVYLNFGEPIRLPELVSEYQVDTSDTRPSSIQKVTQALCEQVAQRINSAAAVNPINIVALAMLSSPRFALSHDSLVQQTELYRDLLNEVPYSTWQTLPEGTPADWIESAGRLGVLSSSDQPMGHIHTLSDHYAVLMTYYRNNVLHLFALPSLVCCGLLVHGTNKSRERLMLQLELVYPYVRRELFLHWSPEEMQAAAHQYLDALVRRGLIRESGSELSAPEDPVLRVQFMALARLMLPTLERYYLTLSMLNATGPGVLSMGELESRAQEVAQMVSVLNGLNAPEFFDKALFKGFIRTLRERSVIALDEGKRLRFDDRIRHSIEAAESVLDPELVRNVRWLSRAQVPAPAED